MRLGEGFDYNVLFEKVESIEESESKKDYFDHPLIGGDIYSISINGKGPLEKSLMNHLIKELMPSIESLILNYPEFKEKLSFNYRGGRLIDHSEN